MTLIACGGCTTRWSGLGKAHCAGCHRTFGGVSGFDMHRVKDTCTDPADHGLVLQDDIWIREVVFAEAS